MLGIVADVAGTRRKRKCHEYTNGMVLGFVQFVAALYLYKFITSILQSSRKSKTTRDIHNCFPQIDDLSVIFSTA